MENYTMSAAIELAEYGITANVVHPPVTDTGWIMKEVRKWVAETGSHIAYPEEVAAVVVFLSSATAGLISGNVIRMR